MLRNQALGNGASVPSAATYQRETERACAESSRPVVIPAGTVKLSGELAIPAGAAGVVLFAHGSGSSRHSPRNQFVAEAIRTAGTGTLLFDLLTLEEEVQDAHTGRFRFDISLLTQRLLAATRWLAKQADTHALGLGYFGASTGAAAALIAAAELGPGIQAVVSRGGRPDLAAGALTRVQAATLLIVGEQDEVVIKLNEHSFRRLHCVKEFAVVPGATHLFEEPGALEEVATLATNWFQRHFKPGS